MQLKFFTFIIGTIFVGLVSGQFPYGNVYNTGAQASASAQTGKVSASATANANNYQNLNSGRRLLTFNNPGNGGGYPNQFPQNNAGVPPQRNPPPYSPGNPQQAGPPQRNPPPYSPGNPQQAGPPQRNPPPYSPGNPQQAGPPQRNPPPYNPGNPQHPGNNGGNNPINPANQNQPPQYPNNNGRNNPVYPQQPRKSPNNNGLNNPPNQYPNNVGRNNPMNPQQPANPYQAPQQSNNIGGNNPPFPGQEPPNQQGPNNYPPRPNNRRKNPNGSPRRRRPPNAINRRPPTTTTQASPSLPIPIPTEYPKEDFPEGFFDDMLKSLGIISSPAETTQADTPLPIPTEYPKEELPEGFVDDMLASLLSSAEPQSEEPTENSLPPTILAQTQPNRMRNPSNGPFRPRNHKPHRRKPGHRRKPTTFNPSLLSKTTVIDETTPQTKSTSDVLTETSLVDAIEGSTPVISEAVFNEATIEEKPQSLIAPEPTESSIQSNVPEVEELKDTDNEINSDVYGISSPETITKGETEQGTTTEAETTVLAEIVSTSSALDATEIIEKMHVDAPKAEIIPETSTSSPTDIPDQSEAIKVADQSTTVPPEIEKDKYEPIQVTQVSVIQEQTTSEPITSSLLPVTALITTDESSNAVTPSASQTSPGDSDRFDIKPGDSEFMPAFIQPQSEDKIFSTTESLPKTTCYCTDGVTYVTTESLANIKKATTPIFNAEEAHTKYSEVSNKGITTPSYTSLAVSKETDENGDITNSEAITLLSTTVTQATTVNSGSTTPKDSETNDSNTGDLLLSTAPSITSTVSEVTSTVSEVASTATEVTTTAPEVATTSAIISTPSSITSTASSVEITTESSDQTTENEDEYLTSDEYETIDLTSVTFDENYYATEIPPPGVTCRDNERYYKCVPNCRHTCFNYDNFEVPCPDICIPGCFCDPGLVVDENGNCVETSACKDYTCKDDEDWWECMPKNHNTCETFARADAKQDFECESGCFCMEGLIQAPDGSCVNPYECPEPVCSDNEAATDCVNACNTCEADCLRPAVCDFSDIGCRPGCDCMDGFKRDANGTCIHAFKCPACTKPSPPTTTNIVDTTEVSSNEETTTPAQEIDTTAVPSNEETTTPAQEIKTTAVPSKADITTPTTVDSTTLATSETAAETSTPVETTTEVTLITTE